MNPRVLFIDHAGVLGGAELSLLDIARHVKATSRVVLLEDGPFRGRLEEAGVPVEVLRAPPAVTGVKREGGLLHDLRAAPGVLRLAWRLARRARAYDVLYANSQKSMIVAAVAGLLARRPVVWHLRDLMTAAHFSLSHRRITTLFANALVTRVIANSHATREAFVENGGRAGRVYTVHNGIDAAPFDRPTLEDAARVRRACGLNGEMVIGVFSRLAHWKGQHVLVEALREVPHAHALLVGEALFEKDQRYAEALRQQAHQLGLADRVHFLGFRDDVPQLMKAVDVVAHLSVAPEPFGRVIVEGMLAQKPVVAARGGGALEIVEHDRTGLLVPPDEPTALAQTLRELFAEPAKQEALALAGRETARSHFSKERMLAGVTAHLRQVAAGAQRPGQNA